ncbi:MAG: hypothetical protein AAFV95_00915 [Bacteroidota bacterium]
MSDQLAGRFFPEGEVTVQININNSCLAQSNAQFNARARIIFENKEEDCIYLRRATRRSSQQLIYEIPGIPNDQKFTLKFKMASIYDSEFGCSAPFPCGSAIPQCCMSPEIFDCCFCGDWESDLEMFWFTVDVDVKAGLLSVIYRVSSRPDRIPGFTSPMQINSTKYGCQCCNF